MKAPFTSDDFNALGTLIYGTRRFQTRLAEDMGRNRETVNRWARGHAPVPASVQRWLLRRAETRGRVRTD